MFLKFDVPLAFSFTLLNALENILIEKDLNGGNISLIAYEKHKEGKPLLKFEHIFLYL